MPDCRVQHDREIEGVEHPGNLKIGKIPYLDTVAVACSSATIENGDRVSEPGQLGG